MTINGLLIVVFSLSCLACVVTDLFQRRLPNLLTLGMHLAALILMLTKGQSIVGASVASCWLAWSLAILLTFPAYFFRWLGAGDVKLIAAVGLLTGLQFILISYAISGLIAGLCVFLWTCSRRYFPYLNLQLSTVNLHLPLPGPLKGKVLPFGAIYGTATLITLLFQRQLLTA